jgi:hypothetical protein
MNDDRSKIEEHARYLVGMRLKPLPSHKTVEEDPRIWECRGLHHHRLSSSHIWGACDPYLRPEYVLDHD